MPTGLTLLEVSEPVVVIRPSQESGREAVLPIRLPLARRTAAASGSIIRVLSPIVLTEDLASPLLPVDALEAVDRLLVEEGARVEHRDEGGVTARLGSRTTFRLWGVFGPGRLRLPLVVEVRAEAAASGSVLRLRMTSDEGGGYRFRSSWAEPAYRERFDQLVLRMGRKTAGPVQ